MDPRSQHQAPAFRVTQVQHTHSLHLHPMEIRYLVPSSCAAHLLQNSNQAKEVSFSLPALRNLLQPKHCKHLPFLLAHLLESHELYNYLQYHRYYVSVLLPLLPPAKLPHLRESHIRRRTCLLPTISCHNYYRTLHYLLVNCFTSKCSYQYT